MMQKKEHIQANREVCVYINGNGLKVGEIRKNTTRASLNAYLVMPSHHELTRCCKEVLKYSASSPDLGVALLVDCCIGNDQMEDEHQSPSALLYYYYSLTLRVGTTNQFWRLTVFVIGGDKNLGISRRKPSPILPAAICKLTTTPA